MPLVPPETIPDFPYAVTYGWCRLAGVMVINQEGAKSAARLGDVFDFAAIVIAVGLIGQVFEGSSGMLRIVLALAFAFFVPGRAIVTNWPAMARWSEFGMPVVLSLAVLTLAATVALWAHAWHPLGLFQAEAGLSVVALGLGMLRRQAGPHEESARRAQAGDRSGAS